VRAGGRSQHRIQQKTVVTQVMDRIRELIFSGEYKVNDRIPTESELAEMFGVGRSSVREAVKIFQHLGVLEARVPKGTFVCDRTKISQEAITWSIFLGQNNIEEIIELRKLIERAGVSSLIKELQAKTERGRDTLGSLRSILQRMKEGVSAAAIKTLVQADYDFHAAIVQAAGNSLFTDIYATLHSFLQEEIRRTYLAIDDMADILKDHEEIIDSICSCESSRAVTRHDEHFLRILRLLREAGETAVGGRARAQGEEPGVG
jgi:DNA-binding FadR family transcriptional regulator